MINTHVTIGSINVSKEIIPLQQALTKIEDIKNWLGRHIISIEGKLSVEKVFSNNFLLEITQLSFSNIKWICTFSGFTIQIMFTIQKIKTDIKMICEQFSLQTFIQEWIYLFYRLKEYIELGSLQLPEFDYKTYENKHITIANNIHTSSATVFKHLTEVAYLRQIFAKYPECDLENFHYSWGWIDEGPNNLISWKEDTILIHDFIVDFNPIGYIKWELDSINDNECIMTLTHKDIDLEDEIQKEIAYYSYKHGWMYFLAKIKDLAENNVFTVTFENEILD